MSKNSARSFLPLADTYIHRGMGVDIDLVVADVRAGGSLVTWMEGRFTPSFCFVFMLAQESEWNQHEAKAVARALAKKDLSTAIRFAAAYVEVLNASDLESQSLLSACRSMLNRPICPRLYWTLSSFLLGASFRFPGAIDAKSPHHDEFAAFSRWHSVVWCSEHIPPEWDITFNMHVQTFLARTVLVAWQLTAIPTEIREIIFRVLCYRTYCFPPRNFRHTLLRTAHYYKLAA